HLGCRLFVVGCWLRGTGRNACATGWRMQARCLRYFLFGEEGLDAFEGGAVDEAAHVGLAAGDLTGFVEVEGRREAAEGAVLERLLSRPGPFDLGADAAGDRVVAAPEDFDGPRGRLAVLVVEVEERFVLHAGRRQGELAREEV